jgi:hypothetical protein
VAKRPKIPRVRIALDPVGSRVVIANLLGKLGFHYTEAYTVSGITSCILSEFSQHQHQGGRHVHQSPTSRSLL